MNDAPNAESDAPDFTVTVPVSLQGVVMFDGSGAAWFLRDDGVLPFGFERMSPVSRAVLIARLRAWADQIESVNPPVVGDE